MPPCPAHLAAPSGPGKAVGVPYAGPGQMSRGEGPGQHPEGAGSARATRLLQAVHPARSQSRRAAHQALSRDQPTLGQVGPHGVRQLGHQPLSRGTRLLGRGREAVFREVGALASGDLRVGRGDPGGGGLCLPSRSPIPCLCRALPSTKDRDRRRGAPSLGPWAPAANVPNVCLMSACWAAAGASAAKAGGLAGGAGSPDGASPGTRPARPCSTPRPEHAAPVWLPRPPDPRRLATAPSCPLGRAEWSSCLFPTGPPSGGTPFPHPVRFSTGPRTLGLPHPATR